MSPAAAPAPLPAFELDANDFPDRNSLINFLVTMCGWSTAKVGQLLELSDRQVRRIAYQSPPWQPMIRDHAASLTEAEMEMMARDYVLDPYTSVEEREVAQAWITSHRRANGLDEVDQVDRRYNRVGRRSERHTNAAPWFEDRAAGVRCGVWRDRPSLESA